MGFTVLYLGLIVLLPLSALMLKSTTGAWADFWQVISDPRVVAAYKLSFGTALAAAVVNAVFGLVVVWVLVRYSFPGRRLFDAIVDLPFAMPTAVSGITLTSLFVDTGWFGRWLEPLGIHVAYTPIGIMVALTFIGLPFVVRTLQPAIEDLEPELEEAAASLGANRLQTFRHVILPTILPALLTGFAMAFARGLGEYGSVIFIAANIPMKTEIAPQLIASRLDEYDTTGACAIAIVMLAASFVLLFVINLLQWWSRRHVE
jgi:sulfate transport system permease protein